MILTAKCEHGERTLRVGGADGEVRLTMRDVLLACPACQRWADGYLESESPLIRDVPPRVERPVHADLGTDFGNGLWLVPEANGIEVKVNGLLATLPGWNSLGYVTADELRAFLHRAYGDPFPVRS